MHCTGHFCLTPKHPSSFPGMEGELRIIDSAMCSQVREGAQTTQIKAGRQPAPSIDCKWHLFSGAASAEGRRWKDGTSSHSIRLPRCPIPYDCCRPCYRFRLLLTVPGCLYDAPLRSLLLPGPSGNSHLHHILHLKPFPHHPSSSSPQCPEGDLFCARHRYIFLVTVLLKAGGDIFHALIMGAYLYIPAYVPYLAMASVLILGTRSKD